MTELKMRFIYKLTQYVSSLFGGFMLAFETSIDFFVPCLIAVLLDVISAYFLGRRVHQKHPKHSDGKFKSEYKRRIVFTMIIVWLAIILANYVDILVRCSSDKLAVRYTVAVFLFYEIWSCLENWSSENDQPLARALQRIMVNKAERHLNVPLSDILMGEKSSQSPHQADETTKTKDYGTEIEEDCP